MPMGRGLTLKIFAERGCAFLTADLAPQETRAASRGFGRHSFLSIFPDMSKLRNFRQLTQKSQGST